MGRKKKTTADKMVNVGVRLPAEAKNNLVDESAATGISEGTLARNYLLLGMQVSKRGNLSFNPVVNRINEVLRDCSPTVQKQILEIIQVLATPVPAVAGRPPTAPLDPADVEPSDEELAAIGLKRGELLYDVSVIGKG